MPHRPTKGLSARPLETFGHKYLVLFLKYQFFLDSPFIDRAETRVRDERPLFLAVSRIFMSSMLDIYRWSCYSIHVKQALLLIEGVFIA